jgi:large subunit ribosomal protein L16
MLQPKRTKYRKQQKGKNRGVAWRGSDVSMMQDFPKRYYGATALTLSENRRSRPAKPRP